MKKTYDFAGGEILLFDKPFGWTSFGVVKKVRGYINRHLDTRVKVGHAGTLDPYATGLLILCTGKATKGIEEIQTQRKTYTGTMVLGKTTPSFDLETEPDHSYPTEHINEALVKEVEEKFIGEQLQVPPIFSAKMIEGKRAYKLARKGETPKMRPNQIEIYELSLKLIGEVEIQFEVQCSKGTYIRSLANDIGKALNSGAYLSALRRERIGAYEVSEALTIAEFESYFNAK